MMSLHLREPNDYPVVIALQRGEGQPWTRVDTGLTARWVKGELVVPLAADQADDVLRLVAQTIRRESS